MLDDGKLIFLSTMINMYLALLLAINKPFNVAELLPDQRYANSDAVILHHGSGDVYSSDPLVISIDVQPCPNVVVFSEAEALTFRSSLMS